MSDFFDKPEWRRKNVEFLKQYATKNKRLIRPYIEMIGESGHEMYGQLDQAGLLPSPDFFIGVDHRATHVLDHMLLGRPFALRHGDFFSIALREVTGPARATNFNYDGTALLGHQNWWQSDGQSLQDLVQRAVRHNGCATLILNLTLTQVMRPKSEQRERILQHSADFKRHFGLNDHAYRQIIGNDGTGAYQVYRSAHRALFMATLRVYFQQNQPTVIYDAARYF